MQRRQRRRLRGREAEAKQAWALSAPHLTRGYLLAPAALAAAVAAYRARGQRFPRGVWAGVASSAVGVLGLVVVVGTPHDHGLLGILGLFVLGILVIAGEGFAQHMTLPGDPPAADAEPLGGPDRSRGRARTAIATHPIAAPTIRVA